MHKENAMESENPMWWLSFAEVLGRNGLANEYSDFSLIESK